MFNCMSAGCFQLSGPLCKSTWRYMYISFLHASYLYFIIMIDFWSTEKGLYYSAIATTDDPYGHVL